MTFHRAHLSDLDELAMVVREPTSRAYVLEAIADYRAGSYRSAIVATWTAVCFDIVAKFRELAMQGDAAAKAFVATVDKAIAQPKSPEQFLAIERGLLDEAMKAGFIGHREQMDLDRVKEDRNYCAHPAFITDGALFQPSADQSRAHIVHAIEHLLRHPPVEGKTAIEKFKAELTGTAFPPTEAAAEAWLKARYCGHVKATTMRSIVVVAIKGALGVPDRQVRVRSLAILRVLERIEHPQYVDVLKDQLPKLLAGLDERSLPRLGALVAQDPAINGWMGGDMVARLQGLLAEIPMESAEARELFALSDLPEFTEVAMGRFGNMGEAEKTATITEHPCRAFVPEAIEDFADAPSYRGAEARGERVVALAKRLTAQDVGKVLKAAAANGQIWDASGTPAILSRLFDHTSHHLSATGSMWVEFMVQMYKQRDWADPAAIFSELRERMEASGLAVPAAPASE